MPPIPIKCIGPKLRTAQDQRYYWEPAWEMNFGHALLARAPKVLAFSLG